MPARYVIDSGTGLVVVNISGELTGRIMLDTARALLADPRHAAGNPIVIDMSHLRRMQAGAKDFLTLGEMQTRYVLEHGVRSRLAVMSPNDLGYAFGRMYQGFSDDEGGALISMVADAEEAAAWLNVDAAVLRRMVDAARQEA